MVQAYKAAEILVTEIDLDDLNPLDAQAVMQRLAVDPQGRNLEKLLGPADYATVVAGIRALALDPGPVSAYEPWFAALQITQLHLAQLGFEPGFGVDARLVMLAVQDGKPVNGLETLEDQLGTLDRLPPAAQREFLLRTLDEADEVDDSIDGIVTAWRNGDVPGLERELLEGLKEQPELYERILVARNRAWTAKIETFAGDGRRYLVVVGALHLVGEDSVLSNARGPWYSKSAGALAGDARARIERAGGYSSISSKSSLPAPHSGHRQDRGTSSQRVPASSPASGMPCSFVVDVAADQAHVAAKFRRLCHPTRFPATEAVRRESSATEDAWSRAAPGDRSFPGRPASARGPSAESRQIAGQPSWSRHSAWSLVRKACPDHR